MNRDLHILNNRAKMKTTYGGFKISKPSNSNNLISDVNAQQTSLWGRLNRFRDAQEKDSSKASETISHDSDPTTAFFNRLKRPAITLGDYAPREPKKVRRPYDQDTSSSPTFVARKTRQHHQKKRPVPVAIEATYAGKADDLERATNEKLDQARDHLKTQIEDLKKQESNFIDELKARKKLVSTPLYNLKFSMGSQEGRNLARIVKDFQAEKDTVEKAVSSLWDEWESLNVQIRHVCERIVAGDYNSQDENAEQKIQGVLDAAAEELAELSAEADKALKKAQKDAEKQRQKLRELWIEEKAREYDNTHGRKIKSR